MMPDFWKSTVERTLNRRRFLALLGSTGAAAAIVACGGKNDSESGASGTFSSLPGSSHANGDPDFATVFPDNAVNQMKLTIGKDDWQAMLDDMTNLYGARGSGGGIGGQPNQQGFPGGQIPQDGQLPQGAQIPSDGQMPPDGQFPQQGNFQGGPMQGGAGGFGAAAATKPMWVAGDLSFNGETWEKVGIRFKGNSSLRTSWGTGTDRMPFKLDFDQWENEFPEIENQRFYGFKQLSLSNNVGDSTGMRETLAYDVFEAAGLPAANTAFYEVILDRGDGETSLGIYTVIEVVDDTLIERVFGDDKGNIYEAEGSAASLTTASASGIETSFQKENNEDAANWSDIEKFVSVLNSTERTSDLAAWRKEVESMFDVPMFLEWLAIATTLQHWDTYGGMTHNYYLYNDDGTLKWISWDHNFILGAMGGGGAGGAAPNRGGAGGAAGIGGRMSTSFDKKDVQGTSWPLIRYLMDVPEYYDAYKGYLKETIDGPFNSAKMVSKYEAWAKVLQPYYEKQNQGSAFETAVQALIQTTKDRNQAVTDFLAT
jgi:hypothetical protein